MAEGLKGRAAKEKRRRAILLVLLMLGWLSLLPFGSLGGAPLTIFTGGGNVFELLLLQALWNALLWPAAAAAFRMSRERMVSHGG